MGIKVKRINKKIILKLLATLVVIFFVVISNIDEPNSQENTKKESVAISEQNTLEQKANNEYFFLVTKVVDGDTIKVKINDKIETLRLIGVDAPETVDPRKPVQCFGKEASNKTKELLNNQYVRLESDQLSGERDKYGRLLRYVFLQDGTNFNKLIISEGFAHEYTYNSIVYKYQSGFKEAEKEARENKRGLWADGICE